jgi:hypothetical protein
MIRDRLNAELRAQKWTDPTEGNIVVQTVWCMEHCRIGRERRALRTKAERHHLARVLTVRETGQPCGHLVLAGYREWQHLQKTGFLEA